MVILDRRACADDADWLRRARHAGDEIGDLPALVQLRLRGLDPAHRAALLDQLGPPAPAHALSGDTSEAARRGFSCVHWPEDHIPEAPAGLPATASVHSAAAALRAAQAGAAAVLFGPVFPPRSKPGAGVGLGALREVVAASPLPVLALGGIDLHNLEQLPAVGGVAALTPFCRGDLGAILPVWLERCKKFLF